MNMYRRYPVSIPAMSLNNQLKKPDAGVDLFALDSKLQVSDFKIISFQKLHSLLYIGFLK